MEADLLMECEEEELEPWQLVDDDVEEDDMDSMEGNDNVCASSPSSSETSHSSVLSSANPLAAQSAQAAILNTPAAQRAQTTIFTTSGSSVGGTSTLLSSTTSSAGGSLVPVGMAPGQKLILTQTHAGLGTTILLPTVNSGTTHQPMNQPIFLTTQGFPDQNARPVPNSVNPMRFVLNVQQGSPTFQPITLLTGPPDGQLFRPAPGLPQPGTTMTTIKIPAVQSGLASGSTLTTTTTNTRPTVGPPNPTYLPSQYQPVSEYVCPRCGSRYKMLAALQGHMCFCCPDLVNTTKVISSHGKNHYYQSSAVNSGSSALAVHTMAGPSAMVGSPSALSALGSPVMSQPKVVMTVEDFYYGVKEGNHKRDIVTPKTAPFKCHLCHTILIDNISLMSHMWIHADQVWRNTDPDQLQSCQYCFRQFSSKQQWKCHLDKVHSPLEFGRICKICEWVFESEPAFLNHMKAAHKPGEMPYVCQVCEYSSSFYSHVYTHFVRHHREMIYLLCVYCLKVTKSEAVYQQHFLRHQKSKAFHCNKCRLQFILMKDLMDHKSLHHRTSCKPKLLEGLPPGAKVTIRAGTINKFPVPGTRNPLMPLDPEFPPPFPVVHSLQPNSTLRDMNSMMQQKRLQSKEARRAGKDSPRKKKPVSKILAKFQTDRSVGPVDKQRCMECGAMVSSFSGHYPTYVQCLLCSYSTCCSRSYAHHMINKHVPLTNAKILPLHKRPPPCYFKLRCCGCDFISSTGDLMAKHLVQFPLHGKSTCERHEHKEFDIEFSKNTEQGQLERNEDLQKPVWASVEQWIEPLPFGVEGAIPFTRQFTASSGPQRGLSKNSDVTDYFNLLFPKDLLELIACETNAHIKTCQFLGWHDLDWIPVNAHDIKAFIGLSILMGIKTLAELPHYWSWRHNENCHTFYRTMTITRFQQIGANICVGSLLANKFSQKTNSDRLHMFRPMLGILGDAMWKAYQPNQCLTIDRALLPVPTLEEDTGTTKSDHPSPPQVWLLCDSKSGYCHRFLIQMKGEKEIDLGFSVVSPLAEGLQEKNHQLFLANSLASVPLMQKLLHQGVYSSSTFPPQSPILPLGLWEQGHLENSGDFLQKQYGALLATRWLDVKEMGCLSTNSEPGEPDVVWRKSQTKVGELSPINRPRSFRLLQENMRGVDICKQLLACNPLGGLQHTKQWQSLFWFLVNLSIVNAFIVLREDRKDHPPPWVQGGLFTQASFRKRLGNQLVKSAQKHTTCNTADFKADVALKSGEGKSVRHLMARLSGRTRRCRTCNKKNLRRESVYGCTVCKVNLCKRASCFWEYHGLPPDTPGNIQKVGLLQESTSNWVTSDDQEDQDDDDMEMGMAPLEELDSESDSDNESQFEGGVETRHKDDTERPQSPPVPSVLPTQKAPSVVKNVEDTLSARQLRITLFALCGGLRQASSDFSTQPQLIKEWLAEKRKLMKRADKEPSKAEAMDRIVEWVLAQREQQLPVNERNLFQKASQIHREGGFSGSFRISYDWAVGFMLQHHLGLRAIGGTAGVGLPRSMEDNITHFTEFTHKYIGVYKLPHTAVAAMDELSVFVDFKWLADETKADKDAALQMISSEEPLLTVYLAALADGTMLPTLILLQEPLPNYVPSKSVILDAKAEGSTVEKELDLWAARVWQQQHVPEKSHSDKAMLILDGHREHVSTPFLAALSGTSTLPAVVPAGCTARLQPLEVCLRPTLQRFLRARWAQQAAEGGLAKASRKDVVQLLVNWLAEPLDLLANRPELVRQSFLLTGLLPEEKTQDPGETRSELLKTLAEVVLGPGAAALEPEEELELEDMEDEEKELDGKAENEELVSQPAVEMDEEKMEVDRKTDDEKKTDGEDNLEKVGDKIENEEEKTDDEDEDIIEEVKDKKDDDNTGEVEGKMGDKDEEKIDDERKDEDENNMKKLDDKTDEDA